MNDNDFQPGEVYEFKRADYIPTRETGKLVFLLKGADGEPVGRTVPFDFQMNDYPEVLTVICRGGESSTRLWKVCCRRFILRARLTLLRYGARATALRAFCCAMR